MLPPATGLAKRSRSIAHGPAPRYGLPMDVDVAVIGGGIAGLAIAAWLAPHRDVVVLEAEETLGYHTTGRSAALYTECYGADPIRSLARASKEYLLSGKGLVEPRPVLFVARPGRTRQLAALHEESLLQVPTVQRLTAAEVHEMCGAFAVEGTDGALLEPDSLELDVDAIQTSYVRTIRRSGGTILTRTQVDAIRRSRDGWWVTGNGTTLSSRVVVNAAGAWGDQLAATAGVAPLSLLPLLRSVFTFTSTHLTTQWPFVVDVDEQWYFKPEGPNLLGSAASQLFSEPHDARAPEIDVALGIERINAATDLAIRSVRTTWAGLRTFTADRIPAVGFDPDAPDFFWLVGQGGSGIMTSPAIGELAASLILSDTIPQRIAAYGVPRESLDPRRLR